MSEYKCGNCTGGISVIGCSRHADKLNTYDWLADLPDNAEACNLVEVQFKPPRKGFFINSNNLDLVKGDIVAVEGNPGHDIGTVTMTGRLVPIMLKKANLKPGTELKKIYRKARPVDMEKFDEAKAREHSTMIESRQIAKDLGLKMKIGDVEYQGDGNKAIFYYIADERVDFRQLIKVLAERFRVRIEMKQIGARQEAGRIGGIGPCGRELCCATWMTNFVSVSTGAARFQDISLNPQKLAGQCAKLKCCMNYEVDQYVEALKRMPSREIVLQTMENDYYFFKVDILNYKITYSTDKHILVGAKTISARRAFEIINMNRNGQKPDSLLEDGEEPEAVSLDLLDQENIDRFDKKGGRNRRERRGRNRGDKDSQRRNDPANSNEEDGKRRNEPKSQQEGEGQRRNDQKSQPEKDEQRGKDQKPRGEKGEQRRNEQKPQGEKGESRGEQKGQPQDGEQRKPNNQKHGKPHRDGQRDSHRNASNDAPKDTAKE